MNSEIQNKYESTYGFKLNDQVKTPKGNGIFLSYDEAMENIRGVIFVNENPGFTFFEFFDLNDIQKL